MDKGSIIRVILAVLGLAKLLLEPYGYEISQELIDTLVNFISAIVIAWAGWKNNYLSKKGQKQKEVLKQKGLTK